MDFNRLYLKYYNNLKIEVRLTVSLFLREM